MSYGVGFVAAQSWAVWVLRSALSGVGGSFTDGLTGRYLAISSIEAALAVAAFAFGLRTRERTEGSRSFVRLVLALVGGAIASSITVGAWPLVPRFTQGDHQLLLQAVAGAIISYAFG